MIESDEGQRVSKAEDGLVAVQNLPQKSEQVGRRRSVRADLPELFVQPEQRTWILWMDCYLVRYIRDHAFAERPFRLETHDGNADSGKTTFWIKFLLLRADDEVEDEVAGQFDGIHLDESLNPIQCGRGLNGVVFIRRFAVARCVSHNLSVQYRRGRCQVFSGDKLLQ